MSDNSQFVAESLAELLVAIANGVREAQEALSQMPALDRSGRPMPSYHLPYLDFQLQVDMDSTTSSESGARLLRVLPLANSQNHQPTNQQHPLRPLCGGAPGEGLPVPVLQLRAERVNGVYQLNVQLNNSAGEVLVGAAVEINLNQAASLSLSAVDGVNLTSLKTPACSKRWCAPMTAAAPARAWSWTAACPPKPPWWSPPSTASTPPVSVLAQEPRPDEHFD